ncbi:hypothetical protein FA13DRAFT_1796437 [Coprinellus micaceus]|uniref:Nephrocystin 3-like N-terminal domain-containing protein n=1 Tax=Coprinellus micaceus TaxID=71717 RepID=A0A4Y7SVB1_COPMI|nr:hypothetical protein FA13DRAFT_1796437 [Coprinellus micaceus]
MTDPNHPFLHPIQKNKYVIYNSGGQLIELFRLLNPIKDASYKRNKHFAPPDSHCLPGTREGVFGEIHLWVKNERGPKADTASDEGGDLQDGEALIKPICWLYGFVGCGKSAIAQSITEEYARRNRLAVSFFFFLNAGDRSAIDRFAATLAHQISLNVSGAKALISRAIIEDPGLIEPTCSLESQLEYLVYRLLLSALKASGVDNDDPYLMIVD